MSSQEQGASAKADRAASLRPQPASHSSRSGIPSAIGPDTFRGDDANLRRSMKALVELDMEGALVPHGIGGHARALLTSAYHRMAPAQPPRSNQARELMRIADLTERRKPLRCLLGFHKFGAFERLIFTSRYVCTRCGAVHLSTGFDGVTLGPKQSRAELIDAAQGIEARQGGNGEAGAVHESPTPLGDAP